eukprot:CAMPEP_0117441888 /NCGR_PEP_ID=MMETSP0759-20121206/3866_1 /TAXON_ID=63605 /ORGANISM="Percolomonas cosmopolitus, Strain WS" /LENGTH=1030 /DNA_ID=CAMNT_0005233755 /DNA_START=191 /DNA_END=3283 /DNA_ORIENTATION=-
MSQPTKEMSQKQQHPFTQRLLSTLHLYNSPQHSQYLLTLSFTLLQQSLSEKGFEWPQGFGFVAYAIILGMREDGDDERSIEREMGELLRELRHEGYLVEANVGDNDATRAIADVSPLDVLNNSASSHHSVSSGGDNVQNHQPLTFAQKREKVRDCLLVLSECYEMGYKSLPQWLHFSEEHMHKDIVFQIHDLWRVVVDRYEEEKRVIDEALAQEEVKRKQQVDSLQQQSENSMSSSRRTKLPQDFTLKDKNSTLMHSMEHDGVSPQLPPPVSPTSSDASTIKTPTGQYIGFISDVDTNQGVLSVELSENKKYSLYADLSAELDVKYSIREGDLVECDVDWTFQKAFHLKRRGNLEMDIVDRNVEDTVVLHQLQDENEDELDESDKRELQKNRLRCLFGDWMLRYQMYSSRGIVEAAGDDNTDKRMQEHADTRATTPPSQTINNPAASKLTVVTMDKKKLTPRTKFKKLREEVDPLPQHQLAPEEHSAVLSARSVSVSDLDPGENSAVTHVAEPQQFNVDDDDAEDSTLPRLSESHRHSSLSPSDMPETRSKKRKKAPLKTEEQQLTDNQVHDIAATTVGEVDIDENESTNNGMADDDFLDETNSWNTDSTKNILKTEHYLDTSPSKLVLHQQRSPTESSEKDANSDMSHPQDSSVGEHSNKNLSPNTGKPPIASPGGRSLQQPIRSSSHDTVSVTMNARRKRSMPDMLDSLDDLSPRKPKRREITTPTERVLQSSVQNIRTLLSNLETTSTRPTEDIVTESVHNIEKILHGFKNQFMDDDQEDVSHHVERNTADSSSPQECSSPPKKRHKRKLVKKTQPDHSPEPVTSNHDARPWRQAGAIRRKKIKRASPQPHKKYQNKSREELLFTPYREVPPGVSRSLHKSHFSKRKSPKVRRVGTLPAIGRSKSPKNAPHRRRASTNTPNTLKKVSSHIPRHEEPILVPQKPTAQRRHTMSRYLTSDKDEIIQHLEMQVLQLRSVVEEQAEAMMGLREDLKGFQNLVEDMRRARDSMDFDVFDRVLRQNMDGLDGM